MTQYKYKLSEILSLILRARNESIITEDEKRTMKEFVITKEQNLDMELEEFEQDKDLRKLIETMKLLSGITEMSSPLDNNLLVRKRRKQKNTKDRDDIIKKERKKRFEEEEKQIDLENCDIGASPILTFTKKLDLRNYDLD